MKWIDTTTSVPSKSCAVLCFFSTFGCESISVEWYSVDFGKFLPLDDSDIVLNVPTHWMHLPERPEAI